MEKNKTLYSENSPHGGLGLGPERFAGKLLRYENIRYAALFPRDVNRLLP